MDYEAIYQHFLDSEFDVQPIEYLGLGALSVRFEAGGKIITLIHFHVVELQALPQFYLQDYQAYGALAHVLPSEIHGDLGSICVNHLDSVSVNYERPELAFEESIRRHMCLITSVIENLDFNQQELLREFSSNWHCTTVKMVTSSLKTLYFSSNGCGFEQLEIYKPLRPDSYVSIPASFIALPSSGAGSEIAEFFKKSQRQKRDHARCFVIPLESVETNFPDSTEGLKSWCINALASVNSEIRLSIDRKLLGLKAKEFWLVFNLSTPSGVTWFGVRLTRKQNKPFPNTTDKITHWKIEPFHVEIFNKERLMIRSGASSSLSEKRVLLVGCGSVGSELADKLGSAGVGTLNIADPDYFAVSNTYRHTLDQNYTNYPKAVAVSWQLSQKYPWIKPRGFSFRLLELRNKGLLSEFDLIIVAIGAPTHERLFHDYVSDTKLKTPVIYTWLEGYGVGGHAVLDVPEKKGCLRCAYVDTETGRRGLSSNLNFLQSDQNIVKNYAGCGEMFIPYGAVSSTQTALIAADLAINYLEKKLEGSTKVSWKGSDLDAKAEGLALTRRYDNFNTSLKKQPLCHPLCDTCSPDSFVKYQHQHTQLYIPKEILDELSEHKQVAPDQSESAGLLIGYLRANGEVWVDRITTPKTTDVRTRSYFKLDSESHQKEVNDAFEGTDGVLGYLGTWHTHPQNIPVPSGMDIVDWGTHGKENVERQLFFIVVGRSKISVYTIFDGKTVELEALHPEESEI